MENIKKLYQLAAEDCKGFSEAQLLKAERSMGIKKFTTSGVLLGNSFHILCQISSSGRALLE